MTDKREITLANLRIGDKFRVGAGGKHGYHLLSRTSERETDMSDKPNAIEEIIAETIRRDFGHIPLPVIAESIIAALDAAGLKVVPRHPTRAMLKEGYRAPSVAWNAMIATFDPATWKPEEGQ